MAMEFQDMDLYQEQAHRTSHETVIGGDLLLYPVLGLAGEVGELLNKIKKIYRDRNGIYSEDDRVCVIYELGDILWYTSEIATLFDMQLSEIASINIAKLADRADRGVIGGSGDNR